MMRFTKISFLLTPLVFMAACGAEHGYVEEHHYHEGDYVTVEPVVVLVDEPSLVSFDMVDSYGNSSEYTPNTALAINPYEDDGWFELYWQADSWNDYWVEFYINDSATIDDAVYVGSQMCGDGLPCDEEGLQFCQYTPNFELWCDTGEDSVTDIGDLVQVIPQTFYFILQVCDLDFEYCEYSYYPVLME